MTTTKEKIDAVRRFLNDVNEVAGTEEEQDLYHIAIILSRVLEYECDIERGLSPIQPFSNEQQEGCITLSRRYLSRNNSGDENSLMARYVRTFFEGLGVPPSDDNEMALPFPPRMERSMNVTSPFH